MEHHEIDNVIAALFVNLDLKIQIISVNLL